LLNEAETTEGLAGGKTREEKDEAGER